MLSPPCRCLNHLRHFNNGYFTANFGSNITSSHIRNYSKDKDDCCTNIPQTECKKVEPWPKEAAATAWRKECSTDPQPPNYDPYRIKIPNVVVPPLPSPDVKWTGLVHSRRPIGADYTQHERTSEQQEHTQQEHTEEEGLKKETAPRGFFGHLKSLFGIKGKAKEEGEEIPNEDTRNMFKDPLTHIEQTDHEMQGRFRNPAVVHPDNWKRGINYYKLQAKEEKYITVKLGYHGRNKYKYAFHEPWNPLDRMTLLEQAEKEEMNVPESAAGPTK